MALSTYTELQTAVASELHRTDTRVTDSIPDFINRAESKINRRVRLREMQTRAYVNFSGVRDITLPAGYLEVLDLRIKKTAEADTKYTEILYVSPDSIHEFYEEPSDSAEFKYTLRDIIELNVAPVTSHTLMIHFLKRWDLANDKLDPNDTTNSNWLLINHPDAYLYGALCEAEGYILRDRRLPLWKTLFNEALADLNALAERGRDDERYELSTTEVAEMAGSSGFDILSG